MLDIPLLLHGCKLFPCRADKSPYTPKGFMDASADPVVINQWRAQWPDCNWAVAAGLNGLFVIDVDPKGLAWWEAYEASPEAPREALQRTLRVRTPRGGLHIYFRGFGPTKANAFAPGIDIRGGFYRDGVLVSGGYCLIPPSRTNDGAYSVLSGDRIEPLPESIKAMLPKRKEVTKAAQSPDKDLPTNVAWAESLIDQYITDGKVAIEGQGGNDTSFRVACSILDKGISPQKCLAILSEKWNPHCAPPWEHWELETIVQNAFEYGEETKAGHKGHQSNEQVFGHLVDDPRFRIDAKRKLLGFLHDYADSTQAPSWLVPDLIPRQGIGMLYGASGSYKSFVTLDIALCLAFGVPGQWSLPSIQRDVLFIAGEGPVSIARKRWPAWMQWQGIHDRTNHRFVIREGVPTYKDSDAWKDVRDDLEAMKVHPAFIVIDTLARFNAGLHENDSDDMTLVTNFMENLARHYDCFVLAIHHEGKDASRGARGSSALYANMDSVFSMKKLESGAEMHVKKQRDADSPDKPYYFRLSEIGGSIVLVRTDAIPNNLNNDIARYDWASVDEIGAILEETKVSITLKHLVSYIHSKYNVPKSIIAKQLLANPDLDIYRTPSGSWSFNGLDYDL